MADKELIDVIKKLTEAMATAKEKESTKKASKEGGSSVEYDPATLEGLRRQSEQRLYNLELIAEEQRLMADAPALYQTMMNAEKELAKLRKAKAQALNDGDQQAVANLEDQIERTEQLINANSRYTSGYDNLSAAQKRARAASDQFFNSSLKFFGLGGNFMGTYVGKFLKFTQIISKGGPVQFFKSLGRAMLNMPLFVLAGMVEKTIKWMMATDQATNAVARAYGGNQKYTESIREQSIELGKLGIEGTKIKEAYLAMSTAVSSRISSSKKESRALTDQAAKLDALGVSISNTMAIASSLNARGLGAEEIVNTTNELMRMGDAIGMSTKDMMDGFQKASATLAVYGPRMQTQVFGKLASAAKAAGVSIDSLLAVAGKFDTFDSAAKTVAGLNAVLGTQFSQTEMLMMTEDKRIETVMQEFKMKGIQFSQLDRFQQKLVAQQLGFKNVDEAAKVLNGTYDEYRKNQALAEVQAKKQKKVDEAMKNSEDIRMKMKIWFHKFVSDQGPKFLAWLEKTVKFIVPLIEAYGPMIIKGLAVAKGLSLLISIGSGAIMLFRGMKKAVMALTFVKNILGKAMKFLTGMFTKETAELGLNTAAKGANTTATTTVTTAETATIPAKMASGAASKFSALGYAAMAFAIALVVKGVADFVVGLAALVNAFKDLSGTGFAMFAGTLVAIGVAVYFLSSAMMAGASAALAAAPGLFTIAGVVFLIGIGVGIAAAGIGLMAAGMGLLASTGPGGAVAILAMAAAILAIGFAFKIAGFALPQGAALTALLSLLGFVAAGIIIVIGILAFNMGTMMDKFAKFFKVASEGKGSVAGLAADIMALGMAMTMMGNPLAIAGTFASIQFMKQQIKAAEASARIAEAEASKAEAMERMFSTAGGVDMSGFSVAFTEIASAVAELDSALGRGKKRIEILRVLETMSSIKGDDISSTVLASGVNKLQVSANVNSPKNYMPENFDITVTIGKHQFNPLVKKVIAEYGMET